MNWLARWFKGPHNPLLGNAEKAKLSIENGIHPCFSVRNNHTGVTETYLVSTIQKSHVGGVGIDHFTRFSPGACLIDLNADVSVTWVDPVDVFGDNGVVKRDLVEAITNLHDKLPYDKRVKIFTTVDGTNIYVNGGFNINHHGFSVEVPCNEDWCHSGYIAGFITFAFAAHYQGKWSEAFLSEDRPNFTYYGWMGDRLSPERLAEKREQDKADVHKRWAAYKVKRKALDAELNDILTQLKKYGLHLE